MYVNLMNIVMKMDESISIYQKYCEIKELKFEFGKIEFAKLYVGNQFRNHCSEFEDGLYYGEIPCSDEYTLSISISGVMKTNVLLRPFGNIRLSFKVPLVFDESDVLDEHLLDAYINTHINIILAFLNLKTFDLYSNNKYEVILMNGICENNVVSNSLYWVNQLRSLFPDFIVDEPSWSLVKKRQGAIKIYIHSHKKGGVIIVNNTTFQLLGFTYLSSFFHIIHLLTFNLKI